MEAETSSFFELKNLNSQAKKRTLSIIKYL